MYVGASTLGTPVATCTTDTHGTCGFEKVPLGDYTMAQVSAPSGYLVSEDVAFSLTEPGQVATLTFVDGTPAVAAVPPTVIAGTPPVPATVIPGKPAVPSRVIPGTPAVPGRTIVLPAEGDAGLISDLPSLQPVAFDTSAPLPIRGKARRALEGLRDRGREARRDRRHGEQPRSLDQRWRWTSGAG